MTGHPWPQVPLGEIASVTSGQSAPQDSAHFGGDNRFVRVSHLDRGSHTVVGHDDLTDEAVQSHGLRLHKAGTIVFPKSGASVRLEKRALLPFDAFLVSHLAAVLGDPALVDQSFLFYALRAHRFAGGKADGYPTLKLSEIRSTKIPLPPLPEQRAIARVLRTVQRAKEATEQVIVSARELKQSLMLKLFGSADWEVMPLGEVAHIERGKFSHRPRNDPAFYGGDVPFVQTGDVVEAGGRLTIYRQTLNEAGLAVSRMFPAGTIVITIAANIGHVGILEFDSAFPDSLIGITPKDQVSNEFLNYYLMTQQPEMDRIAPRGTQKNINIQFLKPWPVPVPPPEDQQEIVSALRSVDRKIAAEESRSEALGIVFDSLLHDLITARRRVTAIEVSL